MAIFQKVYDRLMCFLGFHKWHYPKPPSIKMIYPMSGEQWTRHCTRCNRKNEWLPGYGGSELGCWNIEGTLLEQMNVFNILIPVVITGLMFYSIVVILSSR